MAADYFMLSPDAHAAFTPALDIDALRYARCLMMLSARHAFAP